MPSPQSDRTSPSNSFNSWCSGVSGERESAIAILTHTPNAIALLPLSLF
ncbi:MULTISPECIES: hypothetical protein [unclassified Coleofasciculus]|nr:MULTISPECIES: hypothetical protein [unclassified Coleofasciculus]MBE9127120.1 hypothetical protein [Coleofasciculus sp. LEGE 07081]MBE9149773.1 hypothetical protein [Coleofasciculus sp. LEGE 07092]